MNEQVMQLYQALAQKGMLNMSPEEFQQLPEDEMMKYASLLQQPQAQMQQQMQQPQMRTGGYNRPMYQDSGFTSEIGQDTNGVGLADDAMDTDGNLTGRGGFSWGDSNAGRTGSAASKIGSTFSNLAGNMLKDPEHPESARNVGGNILSSAGQGAAMGSAFGPWGTLIGAIGGTIAGGVQSAQQRAAHRRDVRDRSEGRFITGLSNSYNPEMRTGGYSPSIGEGGNIDDYRTMTPTSGDAAELNRMRNMPFSQFSSQRGNLSRNSHVRKAGQYANGGYAYPNQWEHGYSQFGYLQKGGYSPNLHMQDGGQAADAEIENGEAVLGNPQGVDLYGGADAQHSSPLGFMAQGAQHGELNAAGTEGIPMASQDQMYVGSDKLALDGWDAKGGKKSVAQSMKPYLKYAEKASTSNDPYTKNPAALKQTQRELSRLQTQAEEGKFMRGLYDIVKRKDRKFEDVEGYIMEQMPNEFPQPGTPGVQLPEEMAALQQPGVGTMEGAQAQPQMPMQDNTGMMQAPAGGMQPEMQDAQGMQEMPGMEGQEPMMARGGWIQSATNSIKRRGTEGVCTGDKFGSDSCPPGSRRYNLAETFRSMANKREVGGMIAPSMRYEKPYCYGGMSRGRMRNGGYGDNQDVFYNRSMYQAGGLTPEEIERGFARPESQSSVEPLRRFDTTGLQGQQVNVGQNQGYMPQQAYTPQIPQVPQAQDENQYSDGYDLPEFTVSASDPRFTDPTTVTDGQVKNMLTEYGQYKGAPSSMVQDAMSNYTNNIPSGFMNNAERFKDGSAAIQLTTNREFAPNDGPTKTLPGEYSDLSKSATNREPSLQDIGNQNDIFQNRANKFSMQNLGFPMFNEDSYTYSEQYKERLRKRGYDDATINKWNTPEGVADKNNPMLQVSVNDMSGILTDTDRLGSGNASGFTNTQSSGGGSGTNEQRNSWAQADMNNPRSTLRRGNQAVAQAWNDLVASGAKPTDSNFMARLEAGAPGATKYLNDAYARAHNGTEIGRSDSLVFKSEEQNVKGERDLTGVKTTNGRVATLQEAAEMARNNNWDTFDWEGNQYPVPARKTSSSSSRTPASSSTPSKSSYPSTSSNRGYINTSRTTPATIQPIGKSRSVESTVKKITTAPMQRANGGNVGHLRVGQRITFAHGGTTKTGIVKYYNPYNGDFDIV